MKKIVHLKFFLLFCLLITLAACTTAQLAPVEDGYAKPLTATKKGAYKVKAGDTLYSIAWAFGDDYRELAQRNGIQAPAYKIRIGQLIYVKSGKHSHSKHITKESIHHVESVKSPIIQSETFVEPAHIHRSAVEKPVISKPVAKAIPAPVSKNVYNSKIRWNWPANGRVIRGYSPNGGAKGIDIAGTKGAPVKATADGKVVYSGRGLRGYGELVIIKHNEEYLSAYAHNSMLLVKEGDSVRAGQEIAKMGNTDANQVMLHFEIRHAGKPVNPMDYLTRNSGSR